MCFVYGADHIWTKWTDIWWWGIVGVYNNTLIQKTKKTKNKGEKNVGGRSRQTQTCYA